MNEIVPKILVVDDEKFNHIVYKKLLADYEIEIVNAYSGEDALKVAHKHDFFLILMDIKMPGIDGFEAASLILENPQTKHIPVVFVTAIGTNDKFEFQGYKSGAVDYLTKPINEMILRSKIHVFLELHKQSLQLKKEISKKEQAQEELIEKNKEFEAFAGRVSHDLKNTIGAIRGMAQLFLMDLPKGAPLDYELPVSAENLSVVVRQSEKAIQIVDGIYELSGLTEEHLSMEICDLEMILRNTMASLEEMVKESNATIEVNVNHKVLCSETMIPQLFQNLIINAIKFTKDLRPPIIRVSSSSVEGGVAIVVEDNGPGIPKEYRKKIFGVFEMLHDSSVEGLGVGLGMVKKIVELHNGGPIVVTESEDLKGAKFEFHLMTGDVETSETE